MKAYRILPCLPVVAWAAVAAWSALAGTPVQAPASASPTPTPYVAEPGFKASYNPEGSRWTWEYADWMSDGCTVLMLPNVDAVTVDGAVITINAKRYRPEGSCAEVMTVRGLRGSISYDADATFKVIVDGKQVIPAVE